MEHGIKIENVDKNHLQSVLRDLKNPAASERDTGKLVAAAVKFFGEAKDLGICDKCGGRSPSNLDACPFCGDVGGVKDPPVNEQPEQVKSENGVDHPEAPATPILAGRPARKRIHPTGNGKPAAEVGSTSVETALAVLVHEDRSLATVADLDREVDRYRAIKAEGAVSMWKLGAQIGILHATKLWKQRVKEDGKQVYKNWAVFCDKELGMSHGTAFEMMEVSAKFPAEEVATWGPSKCGLLLRAPEADRPAIKEKIERGASYRDVKAEVRAARAKAGTLGRKRDTGRKRFGAATNPVRVPEKISVETKRQVIEFFTKETMKSEDPKPAKNFGDEPVARLKLNTHTTLHFSIARNNSGQIICVMQAKRVD